MLSTITIGSNTEHPLSVHRMGYGTMQLPGEGVWGEPADKPNALRILKAAVENGVQFIDTADFYGPYVTNGLIAESLYPYARDLVICTKIGATRAADKSWPSYTTPANLRESVNDNLKHLKVEQLQIVHFRMSSDRNPVPFEESVETMFELQKEGKIMHVGLSNVTRAELEYGLSKGCIATVQNHYSYSSRTTFRTPFGELRGGDEVLDLCEKESIVFTPFFTLVTGLPVQSDIIDQMAIKYGITKAQVNLAWLLHKSDCMLPIPGTSSEAHLIENLKAASVQFSAEDWKLME